MGTFHCSTFVYPSRKKHKVGNYNKILNLEENTNYLIMTRKTGERDRQTETYSGGLASGRLDQSQIHSVPGSLDSWSSLFGLWGLLGLKVKIFLNFKLQFIKHFNICSCYELNIKSHLMQLHPLQNWCICQCMINCKGFWGKK